MNLKLIEKETKKKKQFFNGIACCVRQFLRINQSQIDFILTFSKELYYALCVFPFLTKDSYYYKKKGKSSLTARRCALDINIYTYTYQNVYVGYSLQYFDAAACIHIQFGGCYTLCIYNELPVVYTATRCSCTASHGSETARCSADFRERRNKNNISTVFFLHSPQTLRNIVPGVMGSGELFVWNHHFRYSFQTRLPAEQSRQNVKQKRKKIRDVVHIVIMTFISIKK